MNYIEVICTLQNKEQQENVQDIVIALLAELGYESFEETETGVKAYIREDIYGAAALSELVEEYTSLITSVDIRNIKQENWNQLWESNFPMTEIAGRCAIYAPFHSGVPELEYRICILPQMSFGTGHHETTALMIELLLDTDLEGKSVLDMGCGTGILAIFASMKHAKSILAIDIDEWAYKNAIENCTRNSITNIEILQGDKELLAGRNFDIVLANINRNILLEDMDAYSRCLSDGGSLQMSGFYMSDFPDIKIEAEKNGLKYVNHLVKKNWVAVQFRKTEYKSSKYLHENNRA